MLAACKSKLNRYLEWALLLTLKSQVPLRSFPLTVKILGVETIQYPRFRIPNNIQLPQRFMTLQDLVQHLSGIHIKHQTPETELVLLDISKWLSLVLGIVDNSKARRELSFITLLGKHVTLSTEEVGYVHAMYQNQYFLQTLQMEWKMVKAEEVVGEYSF
jgi:hypothetical protein